MQFILHYYCLIRSSHINDTCNIERKTYDKCNDFDDSKHLVYYLKYCILRLLKHICYIKMGFEFNNYI